MVVGQSGVDYECCSLLGGDVDAVPGGDLDV